MNTSGEMVEDMLRLMIGPSADEESRRGALTSRIPEQGALRLP